MRIFAQFISVVFHPLLVPTYMVLLLMLVNPYLFGVHTMGDKNGTLLVLRIFISSFFIPAFSVAMLRFTGLLPSMQMPDKKDRIAPYIITGIFYLWMFRNFLDNPQVPTAYTTFILGAVIALFVAFFINIFSKISVHAVGMGGLVGMIVITLFLFSYGGISIPLGTGSTVQVSMPVLLAVSIMLSGLVGTARLVLQAHDPKDLYGGFLVGFCCQFVALRFMF